MAATLEIEEAALTGESLPVGKSTDPVPGDDVPLGDRACMAYMNTSVTRGRGEMIVTATGMDTEIGHIADLLAEDRGRQDAAAEAARRPVEDHRDDRGIALAAGGRARPGPGRVVRHPVHHRGGAGGGGDPDRAAGGGDGAAVDGHPRDRPPQRDRQAPARGGDARLDLGDLLGQDRHAHAEQDDRPRAGRSPARTGSRSPARATGTEGEIKHVGGRTSTSTRTCCRWSCAPTRCSTARP